MMASQWYMFTENNPNFAVAAHYRELFSDRTLHFVRWQLELGLESNRLHFQGVVKFEKEVTRDDASRILSHHLTASGFGTVDCRPCSIIKGGIRGAIAYCNKHGPDGFIRGVGGGEKDDRLVEAINFGPVFIGPLGLCRADEEATLGDPGLDTGKGKRTDISAVGDAVLKAGSTGDFREVILSNPGVALKYYKGMQFLFETAQLQKIAKRAFMGEMPDVIIHFGKPGVGKTHKVSEGLTNEQLYKLNRNGGTRIYWDAYAQQDQILIDDFTGWIPMTDLLHWCDRYTEKLDQRGSHTYFPAGKRTMHITTNLWWEDWYDSAKWHSELKEAFRRRIKEVRWYLGGMGQYVVFPSSTMNPALTQQPSYPTDPAEPVIDLTQDEPEPTYRSAVTGRGGFHATAGFKRPRQAGILTAPRPAPKIRAQPKFDPFEDPIEDFSFPE